MRTTRPATRLERLNDRIVACRACPRLVEHTARVAREKRASYRDDTYWGRPVPNLLDGSRQGGRLLIVGLAPAAHGANRTGRMFTGDRSGDFLFAAMHAAGFASQPTAEHRGDGLTLRDAAITAAAHCAPPANKPTGEELASCQPFLEQTFDAMPRLKVVLALGQIGHQAVLRLYKQRGWIRTLAEHPFAHGRLHRFDGAPALLDTYHPSQQNTFTGRLTMDMLVDVFHAARKQIGAAP
ncbi:MAG: uracil-DNA glycosylase [Phycisphaeraceae bacterium]